MRGPVSIGLQFVSGASLMIAGPALACDMDGDGFGEADILASIDYTGLTYKEQVAAREEALARHAREKAAQPDRARAVLASRLKIDSAPTESAQQ
ncbi:hypothetical protein WG908_08235 [Sphingobium sp. AN641]|uniref:hypothetical protein n=1 Tax=Sphingobium sp. AN641 TaxID=3133443 RepID=UPI0030BFA63E